MLHALEGNLASLRSSYAWLGSLPFLDKCVVEVDVTRRKSMGRCQHVLKTLRCGD